MSYIKRIETLEAIVLKVMSENNLRELDNVVVARIAKKAFDVSDKKAVEYAKELGEFSRFLFDNRIKMVKK